MPADTMPTPDKAELRCLIPADLMQRVDACMRSRCLESRAEWLVPVLEAAIAKEVHAATLLLRMCGVNPLARDD
jgi:hypothetical protein